MLLSKFCFTGGNSDGLSKSVWCNLFDSNLFMSKPEWRAGWKRYNCVMSRKFGFDSLLKPHTSSYRFWLNTSRNAQAYLEQWRLFRFIARLELFLTIYWLLGIKGKSSGQPQEGVVVSHTFNNSLTLVSVQQRLFSPWWSVSQWFLYIFIANHSIYLSHNSSTISCKDLKNAISVKLR